jgi:lysozyme
MIVGNDVSEAQGQIDWNTYKDNTNFVLMKATEGASFVDHWFGYNRTNARQVNKPLGYYHFARPDLGNSPQEEAEQFCKYIDGDPIREGEILALDFEVTYNDAVNWCKAWLDAVSNHFGVKPFIYMSQSVAMGKDWSLVASVYPLWIADYTYDPNIYNAQTGAFPKAHLQQWENNEIVPGIHGYVDADEFNGTAEEFKAFGYHVPPPAPQPTPPVSTGSTEPPVTTTTNPGPTTTVTVPAPKISWWVSLWQKIKKFLHL